MVPAEGGPKFLKRQSSWHRRRRSKILGVSLNHWKGRGGGGSPPPPTVCGRSNTSLVLWCGAVRCAAGAVTKRNKKGVCNANRDEISWGRSLLRSEDMAKTQEHRKTVFNNPPSTARALRKRIAVCCWPLRQRCPVASRPRVPLTSRSGHLSLSGGRGGGLGGIRREGASEVALQAIRKGVGGGCQSGWVRLLSVTNAMKVGTCRQGDGGWAYAGRPGGGGAGGAPMHS